VPRDRGEERVKVGLHGVLEKFVIGVEHHVFSVQLPEVTRDGLKG
jgi:hypothetical protein